MPNGSLDRWIHSNFEGQNGQGALSLSQRLDIAMDIMDALDYLHNGCQPSIIHFDLKPSNILLNQDMRACVGDFGIARVLDEGTSDHPVNSSSTIGIRGSIGYIAPGNSNMLFYSPCASYIASILSLQCPSNIVRTHMCSCFNPMQNMEKVLRYQLAVTCLVLVSPC
jgi:serine/threonine protein kinase